MSDIAIASGTVLHVTFELGKVIKQITNMELESVGKVRIPLIIDPNYICSQTLTLQELWNSKRLYWSWCNQEDRRCMSSFLVFLSKIQRDPRQCLDYQWQDKSQFQCASIATEPVEKSLSTLRMFCHFTFENTSNRLSWGKTEIISV